MTSIQWTASAWWRWSQYHRNIAIKGSKEFFEQCIVRILSWCYMLCSMWKNWISRLPLRKRGGWVCWSSRLVSLYSVIQTLWCIRCGLRPWTRDSPGLRSSPHATSVLGRSLPLTIRWTMAIPASPLPQTLKMAAYLASVGLKTVLVSYIRNLTLSVKCPTPRTCNFWSKLILKTPIIYMLHCTSSQC